MANELAPALRNGKIDLETAARRVWLDREPDGRVVSFPAPVSAATVLARSKVFARRTDAAYDAIDDFEASAARGVWPKLSKAEIVWGLRRRVLEPWRVDQGPTPFCGPAAIVFELARRDPARYVRIVRRLFETGSFTDQRRKTITASRKLRTFPPHGEITEDSSGAKFHWSVPDVDWILLATLREDANLLLGVTGGLGGLNAAKGATTAWEMVTWSKRILGSSGAEIRRAKPMGEFGFEPGVLDLGVTDAWAGVRNVFRSRDVGAKPALQAAVRTLANGGSAMLMVNSRMLKKPATPNFFTSLAPNVATHWISLVSGHAGLSRLVEGTSLRWTNEVARDRPGTRTRTATWTRPITQLSRGNRLQLSTFTWEEIEFRSMSLAGLRRHLFAVVLAP